MVSNASVVEIILQSPQGAPLKDNAHLENMSSGLLVSQTKQKQPAFVTTTQNVPEC